jgi:uncharacterized protein YdeI (YjbR/CyaY-like superfamily)
MKTKLKPVKLSSSRAVAIPPALKNALAQSPKAKAIFDRLAPSHRKEYVKWISEAKQPETMQRRLEKMIPMLLAKGASK